MRYPKLYIPRNTRKLRQKLFLSDLHKEALDTSAAFYTRIMEREVSNSVLMQRAVELLVARALEAINDPTAHAAEVAAIANMTGAQNG